MPPENPAPQPPATAVGAHARPGLAARLVRDRRSAAAGAGAAVIALTVAAAGFYVATSPSPGDPSAPAAVALVAPPSASPAALSPAAPSPSLSAAASPAPSSSAPSSPAATAAAAAAEVSRNGWIDVDQAAWKKQVAAYRALDFDTAPASNTNLPEFRADCAYSHSLPDDPIVFPGLPGASHMHSFVGNESVDAGTVSADLTKFTSTTCVPKKDHSSYWVPTLYEADTKKPVETTGFRVYYRNLRDNSDGQLPVPTGLRMIAGDAKKKEPTPRGAQGQFYCAFYGPGDIDGYARSTNGNWPLCAEPATLHFMLQFPDCWDGEHLDSPNHKDHVAFGTDEACPATHPVRIPAITFDIQYGAKGRQAGYYLASDPEGRSASSMHGDAFVVWDETTMNTMTKNCILQRKTCNNTGFDN